MRMPVCKQIRNIPIPVVCFCMICAGWQWCRQEVLCSGATCHRCALTYLHHCTLLVGLGVLRPGSQHLCRQASYKACAKSQARCCVTLCDLPATTGRTARPPPATGHQHQGHRPLRRDPESTGDRRSGASEAAAAPGVPAGHCALG